MIEEARARLFGGHKPPDTLVGVQSLAQPGFLIEVDASRSPAADPPLAALTAAELRLLPPLRRDRRGLIVSRSTVRSEANSIYRKLGASSRSEAVAQVGGLGLPDW